LVRGGGGGGSAGERRDGCFLVALAYDIAY